MKTLEMCLEPSILLTLFIFASESVLVILSQIKNANKINHIIPDIINLFSNVSLFVQIPPSKFLISCCIKAI